MTVELFDTIIIGFGKGGKTLAGFLGAQGQKVAMIEKSKDMYGGTCINIACIPSKSLALQAEHIASHNFESWEERKKAYAMAIEKKDQLVSKLREKNFSNLDNNENVNVINGKASFLSKDAIKVTNSDNDSLIIKGKNIFINTGSLPNIPGIEGIQESKLVYTSTSMMAQKELPKHLAIIGGGYIGLEFASMYANFGSKVTMFEGTDTFLAKEDRDIAEEIKKVLDNKGIEINLNTSVQKIEDNQNSVRLSFSKNGKDDISIEVDAILVATGRKANIEALNLKAAGVNLSERNFVKTDDTLKTNIPHIWAIGDVNGGPQYTYISLDDFRIVRDQLYGDKKRTRKDRKNIPFSVFIEPPLSRVGLTEKEAKEAGYEVKVLKIPAASIPRANQINKTEGMLKAIIDNKTNKILGCALFCSDSSEIINIIKIVMDSGQDFTVLKDNIFTHPSMAEALNDLFAN
ncbi:pyridine nucleotide-disulfide oxidoreductase [Peribacillus cavernae]|uniref:Pyridine nucleotide-disulfide oxidoreductase n=1 Tax=Peribacillus cavernae TaxID=1674310 RepID=A0A433HUN8_9BACI|nr:FAD-dependent oxidoreductase [Peribacillus cavernae]MDQ0219985.1 pyruvate/2-oxoglutarate dehydrogenase complex dihydrolipoamide dehydrogenase (E3) component [Peribacillus cavernae]RUQ32050.1 pyridine nucleotide-disulfide oxidoreductase [Peribacillus cavernae]